MSEEAVARFDAMYAQVPPWEIDRPQPAVMEVAHLLSGLVLDSGCGTGENTIALGKLGLMVHGYDLTPHAIERAKRKLSATGDVELASRVIFAVGNALKLESASVQYDAVIDSGVFHIFDDAGRATYERGLRHVLKPGGLLVIVCFSELEPGTIGPRRVSEAELRSTFGTGWEIQQLERTHYHLRTDVPGFPFTAPGAKGWRLIARKID